MEDKEDWKRKPLILGPRVMPREFSGRTCDDSNGGMPIKGWYREIYKLRVSY